MQYGCLCMGHRQIPTLNELLKEELYRQLWRILPYNITDNLLEVDSEIYEKSYVVWIIKAIRRI